MQREVSLVGPFQGFDDAARAVLISLHERSELDSWLVVRDPGDAGVVLSVNDHRYGVLQGKICQWPAPLATFFPRQRAVTVEEANSTTPFPLRDFAAVEGWLGTPLYLTDGVLFGALFALSPRRLSPRTIEELPQIELTARLLVSLLDLELKAQLAIRRADRVEAESKLDPLTGLYNRRGWETLFEREESRCLRYGAAGAVVSLDLDGLKKINDSAGHPAGDRLIAAAARCLSRVVRNTDVVARLGGDEFGVLLVETSAAGAETLLERIRARFASEKIEISIGCAVRDPMSTLYDALSRADEAMFAEKRQRKVPQDA